MEQENNQTENLTGFQKFSKGWDFAQKFILPLLVVAMMVFQFGWNWRTTEASTAGEIIDLKKGQAEISNQSLTFRNERLNQIEQSRKETKEEFQKLRDDIATQNAIEREDRKRLEDKIDKFLERQLK